jgi:predicted aldo/keto reductase-like oxidoreductase
MEKSSLNRRNFLRLGAAATAGLATSTTHISKAAGKAPSKSEEKIITRQLGNTGISVPIVSMGVMRADNPNILKAAYNLGIKHFDTAHSYQEGRNEEMVGEFFKDKPRDSFVVATKIHPSKDASTQDFLDMLEVSLERLQMDYVDILYLHAVNDEEYLHNPKFMAAMKKAKEEGTAKHLGFSTHRNMAKLIDSAVDKGFYEVILTSYNFRHVDNSELNNAIKKAHDAGVGIIGMKNMAGGFLDEEKTKPVNGKAALKFALSNPHIHACIPGIVSYEMLMENWSVAKDVTLTPSEKQDLELASMEKGMYCTGCDTCSGQCKKGLPVSDLMRSYMYNYAYAYPAKARETVVALGVSENPCADCDDCFVNCQAGFDVKNRITNIARIQNVPSEFLV